MKSISKASTEKTSKANDDDKINVFHVQNKVIKMEFNMDYHCS